MNTSVTITHSRKRTRHRLGRRGYRILLAALLLMCMLGAVACPMVAHAAETEASPENIVNNSTVETETSTDHDVPATDSEEPADEVEAVAEDSEEAADEVEAVAEDSEEPADEVEVVAEDSEEPADEVEVVTEDSEPVDLVHVSEDTFNEIARLNLNSYNKENQNFRIVELRGVSEKPGGTEGIWHDGRCKCYVINDPDNARIVVEYQNVGTYNGKPIDCRLSFYGFVNQWGTIMDPMMNVGYYFQMGHWAFSLDAYITQYDYYYHGDDPSNVIEMRDAFMTTLDIDSGERIVYMNNDQVAGYVAPQSTVYSRNITYKGQTYRAFDSHSSYHNDATQTLQENSVAIPLTGTSQIFLNELTADEEVPEVGYSSSYLSPSTYSLGYDLPVIHLYDITTEVVNGTITESETEIISGEDRTITYAPDEGYILDSVTVDGEVVEAAQDNAQWVFENIQANHAIKVVYVAPEHPVKSIADHHGNNLVGQYITDGEEAVYTITAHNPSGIAQDMTITDTIPSGFRICAVSNNGQVDGQRITWTLQGVAPHGLASVTVTVAAVGTDEEQVIDNLAELTIGGNTLASNNVRVLIPVRPKVTTRDTTVTNTTVHHETVNEETVNHVTRTETVVIPVVQQEVIEMATEEALPAMPETSVEVTAEPEIPATDTGSAVIATGDDSAMQTWLGLAILAGAVLASWFYVQERRTRGSLQ